MTSEEVMKKNIMAAWKEDLHDFEIFNYTSKGEGNIEDLEEILEKGENAVLNLENELSDYNDDYIYDSFVSSFDEFLNTLSEEEENFMDGEEAIELRDEMRYAFEEKVINNFEILYDYDVLLIDKTYPVEYDGIQNKIDWKDSQSVAFRKRALKYITKDELKTILLNTYGGEGYIAAIVNGKDIIEAVRGGKKTVGGNVVIGVHDWWNGAGYFEESKEYIDIKLKNKTIDTGEYSVGGVFGTADWNY